MDKKEHHIAPTRQLQVVKGQYQFKQQTSQHFHYKTIQKFPVNTPILSSIIKTHRQITHPLLICIISQTQLQQKSYIVTYQNVQLSLQQWIINNIVGNSVWIQLEKLVIAIRELANCFVVKGVNVINAINICNIGVKLSEESNINNNNICNNGNTNNNYSNTSKSNSNNNKQIKMPIFKIYINISKCQIIQKMSDIAKYVIQTDKLIYSKISKQINQLATKIQKQSKTNKNYQYNKYNQESVHIGDCKMSRSYYQPVVQYEPNNSSNNRNIDVKQCSNKLSYMDLQQLQFSQTKTRRKRQLKQKQPNNLENITKIANNTEINNSNTQKNIQRNNNDNNDNNKSQNGHMYVSQCNFNQLNMQVRQAVNRSKKTLLDFRKYIKNM